MDKLYWLDKIKLLDRAKVGDKAFYLSRIMQRGYPVVPGFVVSAEVLRQFLETLNSSESLVADLPHSSLHLDVANWRQLQQVAGRLRQEVTVGDIPADWVSTIYQAATLWQKQYLVLRPSLGVPVIQGTGNISGLMEAVFCSCNQEAIAQGLKLVWSQLFRARSLLYWQNVGIDLKQVNLAVLVQPVENAIASGVLNASPSTWEIESTYGLGVAITNGEILPDVHYIQPETGLVIEQQLGNKVLAYCVPDDTTHGLQVNILDEIQQKQYSLTAEYLQHLIALGNQLVNELGTELTFKWTITQSQPIAQLYITQVSTPHSIIPSFSLLKGIGSARGRVIAKAHVIIDSQQKPEYIPPGVILVTKSVTPDWLPLLKEVAGIVTEQGGLTSHAAILARELAIPSIVSVTDATSILQTGEKLLLDGDRGEVYRLKGDSKEAAFTDYISETKVEREIREPGVLSSPLTPSTTPPLPMIATQLLVNLSQPSLIEQVQNLPVDGVGLLRSELMVLTILEGQHPNNWLSAGKKAELLERWTEQMMQFTRAFAPRPVFYRSLDWRSPDLPSLSEDYKSSILGDRGVINYMRYPAIFELELQALAKVQKSGYKNLHLLLPFVRTVEEFKFCHQKVEQAGLTQVSQFQLWMMAEVPSVLFLLPEYIKAGAAGISIGTNDLTQLLLGVDREQGHLAQIYDERHPAVMKAIAQIIKMAKEGGIPCSICGQAPALYPEIIDQLVEWGITSISVEPEAVERTYRAIARAEQRIILAAARRQLGN
ncbi:MAG TPA: putative PEP-binding protein [Nostocaceae cyanobacterium]|nr:putative PEP-binding protein [Nostocaceae cyanobacterium]